MNGHGTWRIPLMGRTYMVNHSPSRTEQAFGYESEFIELLFGLARSGDGAALQWIAKLTTLPLGRGLPSRGVPSSVSEGALRGAQVKLEDAIERGHLVVRSERVLAIPRRLDAPAPWLSELAEENDDPSPEVVTDELEIRLEDEDGESVAGLRYEVTLPNGSVSRGTLSAEGTAFLRSIPPGPCEVRFPQLGSSVRLGA